jgi:hypothetical protein
MHYSVIYSLDVPRCVSIEPYAPPRRRRLWELTEADSQYDYGYLEGRWDKGKHRKWCALLSQDEFREFVEWVGLFPEDVHTMGSIGAPGFGIFCVPAIAFRSDDEDAIQSAYVTPAGTKSELAHFLLTSGRKPPLCLTEDDDQGMLPGCEEQRKAEGQAVWDLLRATIIEGNY